MNRQEAQITASAESEHYRPLSIGTISLLLPTGNSVLAMLMGGSNGAISANHEDLIVFLYVHHKAQKLSDIRALLSKGKDALTNAAYDWVDGVDAMELAEGVDYYTDTQTRIELLSVDNITDTGKTTEKKNHANPDTLTYLSAVLRHYLNFTAAEIETMPYCQVLCYLHSVMIINGNNTKWRNEDKAQTAKDTAFIQSLDL